MQYFGSGGLPSRRVAFDWLKGKKLSPVAQAYPGLLRTEKAENTN